MWFEEFEHESRYREIWESVQIARPVSYSLFTFGDSELPYFLVCDKSAEAETVTVTRGEVRITRPTIITPDNVRPEFHGFFGEQDDDSLQQAPSIKLIQYEIAVGQCPQEFVKHVILF